MSRSQPNVKNPSTRFFQWSGGADIVGRDKDTDEIIYEGGKVNYYDKDAGENIPVPFPFSFLVLDELTTITGFNDGQHSGYWSNEVRDIKNGILTVRTKAGIQAKGTYAQIKAKNLNGLKYAKSVYIAYYNEEKELVIGNFKLSGAAFTSWIDFSKTVDVERCAIVLSGADGPRKKGKTVYFVPVFEARKVGAVTENAAAKLDEQLQAYLNAYMTRKPDSDPVAAADYDEEDEDDSDIHNIAGIDNSVETLDDGTVIEDEKKEAPKKKETKGDSSIKLNDVEF